MIALRHTALVGFRVWCSFSMVGWPAGSVACSVHSALQLPLLVFVISWVQSIPVLVTQTGDPGPNGAIYSEVENRQKTFLGSCDSLQLLKKYGSYGVAQELLPPKKVIGEPLQATH
ncbi:hypothetical protein EMCRGX_G009125 [Ephydatia muelleri]